MPNETDALVSNITRKTRTLFEKEARIAVQEWREKARQAGFGGALVATAAVLGFYAGAALSAAVALLLAKLLPSWLAAAITGAGAASVAAGLAAVGVKCLRETKILRSGAMEQADRDLSAAAEDSPAKPE